MCVYECVWPHKQSKTRVALMLTTICGPKCSARINGYPPQICLIVRVCVRVSVCRQIQFAFILIKLLILRVYLLSARLCLHARLLAVISLPESCVHFSYSCSCFCSFGVFAPLGNQSASRSCMTSVKRTARTVANWARFMIFDCLTASQLTKELAALTAASRRQPF